MRLVIEPGMTAKNYWRDLWHYRELMYFLAWRDVIVRYIVSQGTINPSADGNWSFAPLAGTSVVFETGPRAKDFINQVKSLKIEPAGEGEAGFAKYRITL